MDEKVILNIVVSAGTARSQAMMALREAKTKDRQKALEMIEDARASLNKALESQTELVDFELGKTSEYMSLLLVHAQDHLMNAITIIDLVSELIDFFTEPRGVY